MKRFVALFLVLVSLFSVLPVQAFAEEASAVEETAVAETPAETETTEAVSETYGTEVALGSALYYIEDGNLLCSVDSARPSEVAKNVNWVIVKDGAVYFSVVEEYTTMVFKGAEETLLATIFCPIDAFDIVGQYVYYSYNGEVFKLDPTTGTEETVLVNRDLKGFYVDDMGEICRIKSVEKCTSDNCQLETLAFEVSFTGKCKIDDMSFIKNQERRREIAYRINKYI